MLPLKDEISTGLDSSTTFQIVRNFRDFAHLAGGTVLIALLQPAPEVFDLFDDVMLLSEGAHDLQHCMQSCCQLNWTSLPTLKGLQCAIYGCMAPANTAKPFVTHVLCAGSRTTLVILIFNFQVNLFSFYFF